MMKNLHPRVSLEGVEKMKNLWAIWRRHIVSLKWVYLIGILATFMTGVAEVATPMFMGRAVDKLLNGQSNLSEIWRLAGVFVALLALQALGRYGWRITIAQQAHHLGAVMKSKLWDRIRFLPEEKITQELRAGEVMNLATADVNMARFTFSFTLVMLADLIFLSVLGVGSMLLLNWKLTLLSLAPALILPRILMKLARRESKQYEKGQETLSALNDLAARCVETLRLQRLNSTEKSWRQSLEKRALNYLGDKASYIRTSLLFYPVMSGMSLFCYGIGVSLGVREVMAGRMSPGEFISFQSLIFVVQTPLQELGFVVSDWQRSFTSLKRLLKAWSEKEFPGLRDGGDIIPTQATEKHVRIQNLGYVPPGQSRDLYRDLSFSFRSGEQIGLWGPIGSGKSTLFKILLGLENNYQGKVEIFGANLRGLAHESVTDHIALVPQRPFMFSATIRENLRLDLEDLSDNEIWQALEVAEVASDFRQLPKGLETHLGEWGINLSGGQKQRLALARSLLRKPKLLLLDDCLSAVDTATEEKILASLKKHVKCSVIWIAHRRSTLRSCTRVIELGSGAST